MDPRDLLTVEDLAGLLRLTPHGVRAMLRRRELPASRIGRKLFVRREALEAHQLRSERRRQRCGGNDTVGSALRALRNIPGRRGKRADREWTEL